MIKRFKENQIGRDFFTTDLHGCYDLLHEQMKRHAFDTSKDRLFVGRDWCDRGPQSADVLDYIYEPYIHSIQANHEAMLISAYLLDTLQGCFTQMEENGIGIVHQKSKKPSMKLSRNSLLLYKLKHQMVLLASSMLKCLMVIGKLLGTFLILNLK